VSAGSHRRLAIDIGPMGTPIDRRQIAIDRRQTDTDLLSVHLDSDPLAPGWGNWLRTGVN